MTPFVNDTDFVLHVGDVLEVLGTLPDESVHCVVTSPPYWGLRDYGTEGQLGLEPTPEEYVTSMVAVFREVRRVLRRDGTCWLNIGDSYASGTIGRNDANRLTDGLAGGHGGGTTAPRMGTHEARGVWGKPKDLVGIPWRLAFALQADGWYLRSDIIWSKPNPMPESVTDRPTKAHEYLFLLTKSARYFYDADAIREPAEWARWGDQTNGKHEGSGSAASWIGSKSKVDLSGRPAPQDETLDGSEAARSKGRSGVSRAEYEPVRPGGPLTRERIPMRGREFDARGRNKRSVWEIATEPYPDAHFATFPQALVEPCVLAGTSERGCCPACRAPWERETERTPMVVRPTPKREAWQSEDDHARTQVGGTVLAAATSTTTGWRPTCECVASSDIQKSLIFRPDPCTVLDPFMGSGTVAVVARRLGRRAVGIELNPEYAKLAAKRLQQLSLLAA